MKKNHVHVALATLIWSSSSWAMRVDVHKDTPIDVFAVTNEVVVENPARFGLNFESGAPVPWYPTRISNLWNVMSSMESYEIRHIHTFGPECRLDGSRIYDPHNSPNETGKKFWHCGLGFWNGIPAGIYDGGKALIYHIENSRLNKVYEGKILKYSATKGDEFVDLEPVFNGPLSQNDILVVERRFAQWPSQDSVQDEKLRERFSNAAYNQFAPERKSGVSASFDEKQFCPEGGSSASLKISMPGGKNKGMFQWFSSSGDFQQILPDGATFKVQAWMRQEGMPSGKVSIICGKQHSEVLTVGTDWRKHEFSFKIDSKKIPAPGKGPDKLGIYSEEAGTLWVDNFAIWDSSEPLGEVRGIHRKALRDGSPATIRSWTLLHRNSLDDALFGGVFTAKTTPGKNFDGLNLHQELALCKELGADPWLNLDPLQPDEELDALMEYLCGAPGSKYGARRAAAGQKEPWSEIFKRIHIECGNETWNTIFAPRAWPGKPEIYAAVANRMFSRIKNNPFYKKEKFICVASGFGRDPGGWTKKVAELATEADVIDVAAYFGGSDGLSVKAPEGTPEAEIAKEIIKGQLMVCSPGIVGQPRRELAKVQADLFAKTDRKIQFSDYESGPGYIIPGPGKTYRERDEMIGKSLGMGVVTLDCFLMEMGMGFVAQNYFKYNVGHNWVTHNNESNMFPHASWIALSMRNKHCKGALMKVVSSGRKTISVPAQELEGWTWDGKSKSVKFKGCSDIPLTECYAFKDGRKHSFVLFNRSAEETRKVTINLPFEPKEEADLHYLTGSYWDGNADEYKIKEQHRNLKDFNKDYTFSLPPSSIFMFIVEEK